MTKTIDEFEVYQEWKSGLTGLTYKEFKEIYLKNGYVLIRIESEGPPFKD